MYVLPRIDYLQRRPAIDRQALMKRHDVLSQKKRIRRQLRSLGATHYDLRTMESRYLPHIIHPDEYIQGVVFGWVHKDAVMLVATDRRVIYLDKKPLFVNEDEITYHVVSGVKYSAAGIGATVTLHTRIKDYVLRTFNKKCALGFVAHIERKCLERKEKQGEDYD